MCYGTIFWINQAYNTAACMAADLASGGRFWVSRLRPALWVHAVGCGAVASSWTSCCISTFEHISGFQQFVRLAVETHYLLPCPSTTTVVFHYHCCGCTLLCYVVNDTKLLTKPHAISQSPVHAFLLWLLIQVLREGKNRQIRRLCGRSE